MTGKNRGPKTKRPELSPREALFVAEYLIDSNGRKAAIRAGYGNSGAAVQANRLLNRDNVKAAIAEQLQIQAKRTLITADKVLLDINDIANAAHAKGDHSAALRGKELLGKHYKLFTDRHEHGGIGGGPVQFVITQDEADH